MNSPTQSRRGAGCQPAAFTIVELLIVLAVLALGAMLLVPALARTQPDYRAARCLNNHRQLSRAWQMYADDNNDRLVMNFHGGEAQGGAAANDPSKSPWCLGWLDWTASPDNTNINFLIEEKYAKLGRYFGKDKMILKCPADVYVSSVQQNRGWTARVRSVSSNIGIGAGNAETGPWDGIYKHIKKTPEFLFPGPAETWVYVDEHPNSINDPGFQNPRQGSWIDQPASYHDGAAGCAFADGHVEMHKWEGSLAMPGAQAIDTVRTSPHAPATVGDKDIGWMSYRAGRVSNVTY